MYEELRREIECQWLGAKQHHRSGEELILAKILFNLPENRPREALANITELVKSTREGDVKKRYTDIVSILSQITQKGV